LYSSTIFGFHFYTLDCKAQISAGCNDIILTM